MRPQPGLGLSQRQFQRSTPLPPGAAHWNLVVFSPVFRSCRISGCAQVGREQQVVVSVTSRPDAFSRVPHIHQPAASPLHSIILPWRSRIQHPLPLGPNAVRGQIWKPQTRLSRVGAAHRCWRGAMWVALERQTPGQPPSSIIGSNSSTQTAARRTEASHCARLGVLLVWLVLEVCDVCPLAGERRVLRRPPACDSAQTSGRAKI